MMGCFESRRRTSGSGETEQSQSLDPSELKINERETNSYHPDKDKKLTLSMVSNKDIRYWDYDFKGT